MRREALLLLLSAVALFTRPVFAENEKTQAATEQGHAEKHEHSEESGRTVEGEHTEGHGHTDERKHAEEGEHKKGHGHIDERRHAEERENTDERDNADEHENGDERESGEEREREPEQEEESDAAPFTIVVRHEDGRRCIGAMVSMRSALTSAWCAREKNGGDTRELWALSHAVPPARQVARRVARVAFVADTDSDAPPPDLEPVWGGAALDIAVLELESPFGTIAQSRPILMATQPKDCAMHSSCHVVRVVGSTPGALRIFDGELVPGERCRAVAPGWPGVRDSALCVAGPELCVTDRGAGVVCGGKLCGIISRSARETNTTVHATETSSEAAVQNTPGDMCGNIHVAQSVARWRRFLHCAHTLRACGSGGECAKLCTQRQLMVSRADDGATSDDDGGGPNSGGGGGDSSAGHGGGDGGGGGHERGESGELTSYTNEPTTHAGETKIYTPTPTTRSTLSSGATIAKHGTGMRMTRDLSPDSSHKRGNRRRLRVQTTRHAPTHSTSHTSSAIAVDPAELAQASRPSFEFEPNRADFKGGPARTSRVYLKAGEYGDNAAEYAGDEGGHVAATTTTSSKPSSLDEVVVRRISELAAQQSALVTTPQPRAVRDCATPARLHLPFIFMTAIIQAL